MRMFPVYVNIRGRTQTQTVPKYGGARRIRLAVILKIDISYKCKYRKPHSVWALPIHQQHWIFTSPRWGLLLIILQLRFFVFLNGRRRLFSFSDGARHWTPQCHQRECQSAVSFSNIWKLISFFSFSFYKPQLITKLFVFLVFRIKGSLKDLLFSGVAAVCFLTLQNLAFKGQIFFV